MAQQGPTHACILLELPGTQLTDVIYYTVSSRPGMKKGPRPDGPDPYGLAQQLLGSDFAVKVVVDLLHDVSVELSGFVIHRDGSS